MSIFAWKIEICFKMTEKSKYFENLPAKIDFFVKLPEKVEISRKFAWKLDIFRHGSTTPRFQARLTPLILSVIDTLSPIFWLVPQYFDKCTHARTDNDTMKSVLNQPNQTLRMGIRLAQSKIDDEELWSESHN